MEGERRQQKLSSPPSLRQIAVFNMIVVAVNRRPGVEECAREVLRGHSRHPRAVPHRRPRDPRESPQRQKKLVSSIRQSSLCTKSAEYLLVRRQNEEPPVSPARRRIHRARPARDLLDGRVCIIRRERRARPGTHAGAREPAHPLGRQRQIEFFLTATPSGRFPGTRT